MINQGQMAVVLEIEISELFDCRGWRAARPATRRRSTASSTRCYKLGVRSSLLLNKFDNPLAGVRFDSGRVRRAHQRRQQAERRLVLERRDLHGPAAPTTDLHRHAAGQRGRSTRLLGAARRARAAPPRPIRRRRTATPAGSPTSGKHVVRRMMDTRDDRQPRPHEPGGGRRHARRCSRRASTPASSPRTAGWTRATGRGCGSSAASRSPATRTADRLRQGRTASTARSRRRTSSAGATAPTSAASPHQPDAGRRADQLPVQDLRRQGHVRPPEDRRADLRLHEGGRRPLRPLRRVVRRPAPPRRRASSRATWPTAPRPTSRCGSAPRASARPSCRAASGARARGGLGPDPPAARLGDAARSAPASRSSATARGAGACGARRTAAPPTSPC